MTEGGQGMTSPGGAERSSQRRRLTIVLVLNLALISGLVIVGFVARSVSVLGAAVDTFADSIALALGLVAVAMRDRDPDLPHADRPIALVALINATILIGVTLGVGVEATTRLREGSPSVLGLPMAIVSAVTLAVMVAGALVLGAAAHREDVHMRSVLIDTLADAAVAAGVLVAGVIIWLSGGLYWLDPVIALVLAVVTGLAGTRLAFQAIGALRGADIDFDRD